MASNVLHRYKKLRHVWSQSNRFWITETVKHFKLCRYYNWIEKKVLGHRHCRLQAQICIASRMACALYATRIWKLFTPLMPTFCCVLYVWQFLPGWAAEFVWIYTLIFNMEKSKYSRVCCISVDISEGRGSRVTTNKKVGVRHHALFNGDIVVRFPTSQ